jgi:hypothetical protein
MLPAKTPTHGLFSGRELCLTSRHSARQSRSQLEEANVRGKGEAQLNVVVLFGYCPSYGPSRSFVSVRPFQDCHQKGAQRVQDKRDGHSRRQQKSAPLARVRRRSGPQDWSARRLGSLPNGIVPTCCRLTSHPFLNAPGLHHVLFFPLNHSAGTGASFPNLSTRRARASRCRDTSAKARSATTARITPKWASAVPWRWTKLLARTMAPSMDTSTFNALPATVYW